MKTITKIIAVIIFSISALNVYSQINLGWTSYFNGTSNQADAGRAVITDSSGNIYITGFSTNSGTYQDYTTIKYNSSGVQIWTAIYNGTANSADQASLISLDNSGNVIVSGYTTGILSNTDITTIKYNSMGVQQWVSIFNGNGNFKDIPNSMKVDQSGNIYITGQAYGGAPTNYDMVTIKYNSLGAEQWVSTYNGTGNGNDVANSIDVDSSGNVYITGSGFESASNSFDYITIKYNSSGVQSWVSIYNGVSNFIDVSNDIILDNAGNVYITGASYEQFYDFATIKYNNAGVQQWVSRYNGQTSGNDEANTILLDAIGNVFVSGNGRVNGTFNDIILIKYDNSGVRQWQRNYNGPGNAQDSTASAAIDSDGNIVLTGFYTGTGLTKDIATIKYSNSGVLEWAAIFNGTDNGNDIGYSVAINNTGDYYVAGKVFKTNTNDDITIIKYTTPIGIHQTNSIVTNDFELSDNYPNPFNPSTNINFNIPVSSLVKLKVYDINGKLVETLVDNKLASGNYRVSFNPTNLASGIYLYSLEAGNFIQTKKMTLIK
jgi:uncharacterized delta-60 repeat protein